MERRLGNMERRLGQVQNELQESISDLRVGVEGLEGRMIRWMVGLWAGTTVTFIGAIIALVKL